MYIILFLIANLADYFYQADLFRWNNPLWTNGTRADHWGWYLDWFPHDLWHTTQSIRNPALVIGAILAYVASDRMLRMLNIRPTLLMKCLFVWSIYLITRGIGFSLMYKLLN